MCYFWRRRRENLTVLQPLVDSDGFKIAQVLDWPTPRTQVIGGKMAQVIGLGPQYALSTQVIGLAK